MKKVIASASLLAVGALGIQSVHADWAAGSDKPWTISGTLRGFYDDNYNTEPSGPGRKGSFGYEVRPSGNIHWSDGPTTLTASYTYSLQYYENRPGNKIDQSHDFELGFNHNFNERYSVGVSESFVDSQEPEVLDATLGGPLRANGDNYHNAASASFSAQVTHLLGFVLSYANDWWDYTGDPVTAGAVSYGTSLNRLQHLVTLDSRWQVWPETVGILGYQFGAVDYTSGGNLNGGAPYVSPSTRNQYSHYIYVGADHNFRSDLTASVRAGVQIVDFYNQGESPFSPGISSTSVSPYAQINLTYNYTDGGNLALGFTHSHNATDQSVSAGSQTQDQESSTVFATITQVLKPISPNLTASLSGQYQNSVFNGGVINNEADNFYLFGVNLSYQFNHYLSTEVGYNFDLLDSDVNDRAYNRNRVYIGVTASY